MLLKYHNKILYTCTQIMAAIRYAKRDVLLSDLEVPVK